MKTNKFFFVLALGAAMIACTPKAGEPAVEGSDETSEVDVKAKTLKDFTPSKAEIDSVSYLIGVNFGSFIKGYDFGDVNYSKIIAGMKDFVKAKGDFRDPDFGQQFKISPDRINDMFNAYLEKRHNYKLLANKEKGEKFLAANLKKDGVEVTESGLQYKIIEAGDPDLVPSPIDTVEVRYKGTLIDGTVFDETAEGANPARFTLNSVIKGWTEGMQLIGEGGHIELYVPAELAYGESGRPSIEPNSTLIFDIELVHVGKTVSSPEPEK
ncbi:MAG: FKBP-type peptidyl-prolyl cis-trans isomerase [Bacteroidales bacterium]|nr:FKBP-type peptidyl-prolyl cis-trans isomerase [Bacteroidales bacterium]